MILTSGEEIEVAIRTANDTLQMIADGALPRFRYEICASKGIMTTLPTVSVNSVRYNFFK